MAWFHRDAILLEPGRYGQWSSQYDYLESWWRSHGKLPILLLVVSLAQIYGDFRSVRALILAPGIAPTYGTSQSGERDLGAWRVLGTHQV